MKVTIHQAKTQLSKLIAAVERGEEVIIARRDKPVARLVAELPARKKRVLGFALKAGEKVSIEGFDDPALDDEIARDFMDSVMVDKPYPPHERTGE